VLGVFSAQLMKMAALIILILKDWASLMKPSSAFNKFFIIGRPIVPFGTNDNEKSHCCAAAPQRLRCPLTWADNAHILMIRKLKLGAEQSQRVFIK
jgi:hypothetical protein